MSPTAADDRDSPRGLPAHSRAEDLQVPPATEGAAAVHAAAPSRLLLPPEGARVHAAHRGTHQRTQAQDGELTEAGRVAERGERLAGRVTFILTVVSVLVVVIGYIVRGSKNGLL